MNLLMPTGMRNDLSYNGMMLGRHFQATGMSQGESGMRQAVGL